MKRKLAMMLAFCLILGCAVPVYAEEEITMIEEVVELRTAEVQKDMPSGFPAAAGPDTEGEKSFLGIASPSDYQKVTYLNEDGEPETRDCRMLSDGTDLSLQAGEWYAVSGVVTIDSRILNEGTEEQPAHLILVKGSELYAQDGIENHKGCSLVLYGQKESSGTVIIGMRHTEGAGIGGGNAYPDGTLFADGGIFTMYGGNVEVEGTRNGAGIGGARVGRAGTITINGGTVTVEKVSGGAAIGTGLKWSSKTAGDTGGEITIRGGEVNIAAVTLSDGIGGENCRITIAGGSITEGPGSATAGIGGVNAEITITGGEITATGSGAYGAGIGGKNATVLISGGDITANCRNAGAGIGGSGAAVTITDGLITAAGGTGDVGIGGKNSTVTISGGNVLATGGASGDGIGGNHAEITVTSGTVIAQGKDGHPGIGSNNGKGFTLTVADALEFSGGTSINDMKCKTVSEYLESPDSLVRIGDLPYYTILHVGQSDDDDDIELNREIRYGHTGAEAEGIPSFFPGYVFGKAETGKRIAYDNSTVVNVYYEEVDTSKSRETGGTSALFTGTWGNGVTGAWSKDASGNWHFATSQRFCNTWGYIRNPYASGTQNECDWFFFDANGNMLTGWQLIRGKWYYLNPVTDGTLGACQISGVTPDGWTVDENGAWIESIPQQN